MRVNAGMHNVFNNSRRNYAYDNNQPGDRNRNFSHGPPLRNIHGDS